MIVYFSATGNSKYIAERAAAVLGEETVSISDRCRAGRFDISPTPGESLVFISPVYFWGLPSIVNDFFEKMELKTGSSDGSSDGNSAGSGNHYVCCVLTYGSFTGGAQMYMARALSKKGLKLQGRFAVRMVDTWTPLFDCSDSENNRHKTETAEPKIDRVINMIQKKTTGSFNHCRGFYLSSYIARLLYSTARVTRKFRVKNSCIGCGLCAEQCPMKAIKIISEKPIWTKKKCCLCLGCLHRCPADAIVYGHSTEGRGQFVNPHAFK
ncbi:MAG: EFR1 family ferrodoxin [Eubacteriaceae bacterium]|nr:EFR1 family ferrodoxin [Eubacteriaceae bacterium]